MPFVLSYVASHLAAPSPIDPMGALTDTEAFWVEWSSRGGAEGPWTEAVQRSLITLKALTYSPTGRIVAAPTTSLPEHPRGQRNWDYRFCWLRGATLTVLALMNAGYLDEARSWRDRLLRAAAGSPSQLQIMYGLGGERRLTEWEVPWLPGYEGSRPVRIGNGAHGQLQLDVYGEMMDALHQGRGLGMAVDVRGWALACALLGHLEQIWHLPDEGIWEMRGPRRHFTFSKVMARVAFDRAVRSVEAWRLDGPVEGRRRLRDQIHAEVCARGFDPAQGSFVHVWMAPVLQELSRALLGCRLRSCVRPLARSCLDRRP